MGERDVSVPDYQSMMLPLLKLIADGPARRWADAKASVARVLAMSDADLDELVPSGRQSTFENRIGWAATYLAQAGLLERPERGMLAATRRGREVLASDPIRIDNAFLQQFEEFRSFKARSHTRSEHDAGGGLAERNPEEQIELGYATLRAELAERVSARVASVSPRFFEQLVVRLLVKMGYGGTLADAGQAVGRSGDDGIDGIIKEDMLGLDVVYIQAKRWTSTVGRPDIQAFAGSLMGHGASKGVFITTSRFSTEARDYVRRIEKRIVLIDGEQLAELMIDNGIGVTELATYTVKRLDDDFFNEE